MGPEGRRQDPPVERDLLALWAEPFRFDFIQAARLLHALAGKRGPVGHDLRRARKLCGSPSIATWGFPPARFMTSRRAPKRADTRP